MIKIDILLKQFENLTDAELGRMTKYIIRYQLGKPTKEEDENERVVKYLLPLCKKEIDNSRHRAEINRNNRKGKYKAKRGEMNVK